MSRVAARFYDHPSSDIKVIGVTGTNGKTTVSFLICHILESTSENWGRIGTVEYFTGKQTIRAVNTTPDALELQKYLAEMRDFDMNGCVMEVSSHGLDQHRCHDIEFSGAVFTNLTQDHLDYHRDMESYFKAKSILFTGLLRNDGFAVLNANDAYFEKLRNICRGEVLSYSVMGDARPALKADVVIEDAGYKNNLRHFEASYSGETVSGSLPLLGRFNLANAAAAITVAICLGHNFEKAVRALKSAPQISGRVERIDHGQPFEVIIDYAHTPDALKNLLTGVGATGDKILVFGCGGDRDKTKRPIMGEIAAANADRIIVTSDNPRHEDPKKIINDIVRGMPEKGSYTINEKRDEAISQALALARPGDLVIIAGKGHEDYQVVGNTRHYFSDPDVVKTCLKKMGYEGS